MDLSVFSGNAEIRVYDPARALRGRVDDYLKFTVKHGEFGYRLATVVIPGDDAIFSETYGGNTFYNDPGLWSIDVLYRDVVIFSGPVVNMDDEDITDGGQNFNELSADVTIEAWGWLDWCLSGRLVMTSTLARYAGTGGPTSVTNFITELIQKNIADASRPAAYVALGINRTNFGGFTVSASSTGTHATNLTTFRVDHGRSLLDTVRETCRKYEHGLSASISGTTITINVNATRGTNRQATVNFNRNTGTLRKVKRSVDFSKESNVAEVKGHGYYDKQAYGYTSNASSISNIGVRETGETWPSAWTDEIARGGAILTQQVGNAATSYEVVIAEAADLRAEVEFFCEDTVTVYDEWRGLTLADRITELEFASGSPVQLRMRFGRVPNNFDNGQQGAGAAGHRRAGRPSVNTGGDPGVPHTWVPDEGDTLTFDNPNDIVWVKSDPNCDCPGTVVRGIDPGDGVGVDGDTIEKAYLRTCFGTCPATDIYTSNQNPLITGRVILVPTVWLRLCLDLGGGTSTCMRVPAWSCA